MKKVLSILISLCILFTLAIPAFADLAPAGEKHILRYSITGAFQHLVTYTDVETALSDAKSGDIIEFFDDVTFDKQVTIPAGLDLTFVSGTKTEAYTDPNHGYITIGNTAKFGSGSFVSYDENAETRTITSTYKEGSAIVLGEGATLNLKNIAIVGAADNTATEGGIVYVGEGAALNTSNGVSLSGGTLGNEGTKGGAIYAVETAKLNIADTTFSGNNAAEGKDIYAITENNVIIADGVIADTVYNNWVVTKKPTCTEPGERTRINPVTSQEETEPIPSLGGHKYVDTVTAPTCTEQGYTTHVCSNCNDTYVDTYVDALNHDFVEKWSTNETHHWHECSRCDEIAENDVHTFGEWHEKVKATCTEDGSEECVCSVCNYTQTRVVKALTHNYVDTVTAPTCTEQGYTTHVCSNCNDTYVDTYVDALNHDFVEKWSTNETHHWHECSRCDEIAENDVHTFGEWDIITEATTDNKGTRSHVCTVCGYKATEEYELTYIIGDANGDGVITDQDAIYTLFSFFYPEQYPNNQDYDFDGNGSFNDQDAIYLLFHFFYPEKYPLK